jgi:hypothetical protein
MSSRNMRLLPWAALRSDSEQLLIFSRSNLLTYNIQEAAIIVIKRFQIPLVPIIFFQFFTDFS